MMERLTNQKKAILDFLAGAKGHPDAYEIFATIKQKLPQISLATVYRNLDIMAQKGLIKEMRFRPDRANYDGVAEKHHHFVCNICSNIFNVPDQVLLDFAKITEDGTIDLVEEFQVLFRGRCINCARKIEIA
ncbi:transcriptional repressor [Candidatus Microgenomates bacterium]|nr:transcriptional repressor [Candidatus Microgenomates bacterium]